MINYKSGDVKNMSLKKMGETLKSLPKIHGEIIVELIERYGMERYAEFLKENDPTAFKTLMRLREWKV
jgi:transposase-like protein